MCVTADARRCRHAYRQRDSDLLENVARVVRDDDRQQVVRNMEKKLIELGLV